MRSAQRVANLILAAAVVCAALVLPAPNAPPAHAAVDRLPDLGMAYPADFRVERTADGRRLLRFSSIVVNVGAGPFELHGQRATGSSTMSIRQRIFDDAGGFRDIATPASAYFGADGHYHWHVTNLQDFELVRLDNGRMVGMGVKQGFCFFDNYRYGSVNPGSYTQASGACGRSASDTSMRMGLSVGWGDIYSYSLPDQFIDISSLSPGRYRLYVAADADDWFQEQNNANNRTWVDLQLQGNKVKITGYGPRI